MYIIMEEHSDVSSAFIMRKPYHPDVFPEFKTRAFFPFPISEVKLHKEKEKNK